MATIEIRRTHAMKVEDLKKKLDEMSGSLEAKYAVKGRWAGEALMILEGSGMAGGVKGRIVLDASTVSIDIDLPLMLRMMKGSIETSVARKLDKVLGAAS
ncbi:MAG: polyhydroxyalkanoic acid system family protein [Deltaproteobacteria bacterium]|nr:polyhydroxyalkanoic acid system family protein [Deltaproteobacteria bacterium]